MFDFKKGQTPDKVKNVDLVTRNTHVKYESPIFYHSKDMTKVKVLKK